MALFHLLSTDSLLRVYDIEWLGSIADSNMGIYEDNILFLVCLLVLLLHFIQDPIENTTPISRYLS